MAVVIDIGCARHGDDYSIERLIDEFHPHTLYGFDPAAEDHDGTIGGTHVIQRSAAAWTHADGVGFTKAGLSGHVDPQGDRVDSIDLAALIDDVAQPGDDVILKVDAEGSEYELLEHLMQEGADFGLTLAAIEWHPLPDGSHEERRARIEAEIGCELVEWKW